MTTTRKWIDSHAVSFGDSAFMITGSGQWSSEATFPVKRVPGGNVFYAQMMGRGPETATYDLKFASVDDFHNFKLLLGTSATLTLPADVAAIGDRLPVVIGGDKYDRLLNTALASIGDASYLNGGVVTCSATFIRAVTTTPIDTLYMEAGS